MDAGHWGTRAVWQYKAPDHASVLRVQFIDGGVILRVYEGVQILVAGNHSIDLRARRELGVNGANHPGFVDLEQRKSRLVLNDEDGISVGHELRGSNVDGYTLAGAVFHTEHCFRRIALGNLQEPQKRGVVLQQGKSRRAVEL